MELADPSGKTYLVVFRLPAVYAAEQAIGRQLRTPGAWNLEPQEVAKVLFEGLKEKQPEVTIEEAESIANGISVEKLWALHEGLCYLNFPAAYEAAESKRKAAPAQPPNA